MGTISHEALVISGGEAERQKVLAIASRMPQNGPWRQEWERLVSPVLKSLTNGYEWFFVAPDGSKEWWDTSDQGNEFREQIGAALGADVVWVRFGELGIAVRAYGQEVERVER